MSLDGILAAIRREADEELAALTGRRDRDLDDLGARTAAAAAAAEADAARARDGEAATEAARRIRHAEASAARLLRAAREEAFATMLARLRERLDGLRADAAYPGVLAALLAESRAVLPGATVVRVDPRDEVTMTVLVERTGADLKVDPTLGRSAGGLELDGGDGRVVINTVEARLERAGPELRRIAAELFAAPPLTTPEPQGG